MVSDKDMRASNARLSQATTTFVAVFVGATSGIGQATLQALVSTGAPSRIYLVGRPSAAERTHAWIQELRAINPRADVLWTPGEGALLREVHRMAADVVACEPYVDLLFLSAGYAPFSGRVDTAEGIDVTQSLEYYGRMLWTQLLLPALEAVPADRLGRVVSVLAGGVERAGSIDTTDLGLRRPGRFGAMSAQTTAGAMNTVTLERFADEHPRVTFVHSWPGSVDTGNVRRGATPGSWMDWVARYLMQPVIWLISTSLATSGQRYLFQSTSAAFGGSGVAWDGQPGNNSRDKPENGLFLLNFRCNCTPNAKAVAALRQTRAAVWEHTQEVLSPYV